MNFGIFTEEMDRWNLVKLFTGLAFCYCFFPAMLSFLVLLGGPAPYGPHPEVAENPGGSFLWYGFWAVVWAIMFYLADRKRQKAIQEKSFPKHRKGISPSNARKTRLDVRAKRLTMNQVPYVKYLAQRFFRFLFAFIFVVGAITIMRNVEERFPKLFLIVSLLLLSGVFIWFFASYLMIPFLDGLKGDSRGSKSKEESE